MSKALLLLLASSVLALAQLDSNSITVAASRSASLQPDQAVFSVTVQSDLNTSFNDVLAALQGAGITSANFAGVSTPSVVFTGGTGITPILAPSGIQWMFNLPVPLTKTRDTVATLTALEGTIGQNNKSLKLSFSIQGTQVSQQLAQSQTCSASDLISDARSQAQKLANAAGVTLGSVLAMSSPGSIASVPQLVAANGFISTSPLTSAPCTLTVKFAVTRFQ